MVKKIDIVVIGRDVASTIECCIGSINKFKAKYGLINTVFYVDSESVDDSVLKAKKFGAKILNLSTPNPTALKGRHHGLKSVQTEYVAFIDGDMEIIDGAFKKALTLLSKHDLIITNRSEAIYNSKLKCFDKVISNFYNRSNDGYVLKIGGFLLGKTKVLKKLNFHLELPDEEESDLISQYVAMTNKKVFAIKEDGYIHWNYKSSKSKIKELLNWKKRTGFILSFFYSIKEKYLLGYLLVQKKYVLLFLIYLITMILSIVNTYISAFIYLLTLFLLLIFKQKRLVPTFILLPYKLLSAFIIYNSKL